MNLATETFTPTSQQWFMLAGLGALLALWLFAKWRTRPRDEPSRIFRREMQAADRQTQEVRDDLAALLTELQRLSSNINVQLDEKFARLGDALRDADQRIFALRALSQASAAQAKVEPFPPAAEPDLPHPHEDTFVSRVHSLADQGLTPLEIAARVEHPIGEVQLILNLRAAAGR